MCWRLQQLGVEVQFHPYARSIAMLLGTRGDEFDVVILSRHYVAAKHIDAVRAFAPHALVVFDTVDLHFLREERLAELNASGSAQARRESKRNEELALIRKADVTLVVSPVEKELLDDLEPDAQVMLLSTIHEPLPARQALCRARGPAVHRRLPTPAEYRRGPLVRQRDTAALARTSARRENLHRRQRSAGDHHRRWPPKIW